MELGNWQKRKKQQIDSPLCIACILAVCGWEKNRIGQNRSICLKFLFLSPTKWVARSVSMHYLTNQIPTELHTSVEINAIVLFTASIFDLPMLRQDTRHSEERRVKEMGHHDLIQLSPVINYNRIFIDNILFIEFIYWANAVADIVYACIVQRYTRLKLISAASHANESRMNQSPVHKSLVSFS